MICGSEGREVVQVGEGEVGGVGQVAGEERHAPEDAPDGPQGSLGVLLRPATHAHSIQFSLIQINDALFGVARLSSSVEF